MFRITLRNASSVYENIFKWDPVSVPRISIARLSGFLGVVSEGNGRFRSIFYGFVADPAKFFERFLRRNLVFWLHWGSKRVVGSIEGRINLRFSRLPAFFRNVGGYGGVEREYAARAFDGL